MLIGCAAQNWLASMMKMIRIRATLSPGDVSLPFLQLRDTVNANVVGNSRLQAAMGLGVVGSLRITT